MGATRHRLRQGWNTRLERAGEWLFLIVLGQQQQWGGGFWVCHKAWLSWGLLRGAQSTSGRLPGIGESLGGSTVTPFSRERRGPPASAQKTGSLGGQPTDFPSAILGEAGCATGERSQPWQQLLKDWEAGVPPPAPALESRPCPGLSWLPKAAAAPHPFWSVPSRLETACGALSERGKQMKRLGCGSSGQVGICISRLERLHVFSSHPGSRQSPKEVAASVLAAPRRSLPRHSAFLGMGVCGNWNTSKEPLLLNRR